MTHPEFLNLLFSDPPKLHRGETEMTRIPGRSESGLDDAAWSSTSWDGMTFYGVSRELCDFIDGHVEPGWVTLETGCGASTLVFANAGALHTCVTASEGEILRLRDWAAAHNVDLSRTILVNQPSENFLPVCENMALDCVFIDGKHAFPWPIVDYFFSARLLKRGGLLILDDTNLVPVKIVTEFLKQDTPRWELVAEIGRDSIFRKLVEDTNDVAWHMQPFVTRKLQEDSAQRRWGIKRIVSGLKRRLS